MRVAIVGVSNCASSLVQGVGYHSDPAKGSGGLVYECIGDYGPGDLEFVLVLDSEAPKSASILFKRSMHRALRPTGVTVRVGPSFVS